MHAPASVVTFVNANPVIVGVRADLAGGAPEFRMHGLDGPTSQTTRDRVRAALRNSGYRWGDGTVNVTYSLPVAHPDADLAVATAVLLAAKLVPVHRLLSTAFIGELGLDGRVRAVGDIESRVTAAAGAGFSHAVVPAANEAEITHPAGITVVAVAHLRGLVAWLTGDLVSTGHAHARLLAACHRFLAAFRPDALDDYREVGERLQCHEVDALAELFAVTDDTPTARLWIEGHLTDCQGEQPRHPHFPDDADD